MQIKKYLVFSFLCIAVLTEALAQSFTGNTSTQAGVVNTYVLNFNTVFPSYVWNTGGTNTNDVRTGTSYSVDVVWPNTGTYTVAFTVNGAVISSKTVTVTGCSLPATPTSTLSTSTNTCGAKVLYFTAVPPANVTWYWQTTSSGTSTTNSGNYTVSTNGTSTYYLRAKASCGSWSSSSSSITVPVNNPPAPTLPSISTNTCGPKILTKSGTPASGISWYWQGTTSSGQDMSTTAQATTFNVPTNGVGLYYIAARQDASPNCWGASTGVTVTVDNPPTPATPAPFTYAEMDAMPLTVTTNYGCNWYIHNYNIQINSGLTYTPTKLVVGSYSYDIKNVSTNNCESASLATVVLNVIPSDNYFNTTEATVYGPLDAGTNTQAPIGASKSYSDGFGNEIQSQTKSFATNNVLATQNIFDSRGIQALTTLPAPISSSTFGYRSWFVEGPSVQPYSATNFDGATTLNAPNGVSYRGPGSVGWYYSAANTLEPNTPVTSYPYLRSWIEDKADPKKSVTAGAGNNYRMGSGHEVTSERQLITAGELDHYFMLKSYFVTTPTYVNPNLLNSVTTSSLTGWTSVNSTLALNTTPVPSVSSQCTSTSTSGIYPIGGNITVIPGKKYTFYAKGYKVATNSTYLYVTSSTGAGIAQSSQLSFPTITAPTASDPDKSDFVSISFVVPTGVTSIKVGVMWNQLTLNNIFYITDVQLRADVPTGVIGYKYISTDPDGKKAVSFVDFDGKTLASALITSTSASTPPTYTYDNWSYSYYDNLGRTVATVAPNGVIIDNYSIPNFVTTFKYDFLGRLIETTSPDEGKSQFIYSTDGKLRFSQNDVQRNSPTPRFSYTNYDYMDRLIEAGEYTSNTTNDVNAYFFEPSTVASLRTNSVLALVDDIGYINLTIKNAQRASNCSDYSLMDYDLQTSDFVGTTGHTVQSNLFSRVARTQNANATTWYSYDESGHLSWTKQTINGLDTKLIDYSYDYFGNVVQIAYSGIATSDKFYHHYTYDLDQNLIQVETSLDGSTKTLRAKYSYYLHGPLKKVELMNGATKVQGIDYVYTIDGALKSINHADPSKDPGGEGANDIFGMTLQYNDTDYQGAGYSAGTQTTTGYTNQYGGNVKSISWHSPADNQKLNTYAFTYDNINQLSNAIYGSMTGTNGNYSFTPASAEANREGVSQYDKNGNIKSLIRKGKSGNTLANYTYDYEPTTNRLDKVNNSGTVLTDYTYNTIGQMVTQVESSNTMNVFYNAYGSVKEVKNGSGNLIESYYYDDRGDLVHRINYNNGAITKHTYYVRDISGNVMSIYEQDVAASGSLALTEVPLYGADRFALYKPKVGTFFYEVDDHLGNVRGVIGVPYVDTRTATMESEVSEEPPFKGIAARRVNYNPTGTQAGNEAVRLNGTYPAGPGIALKVSPGDVIDQISVDAYYTGDQSNQPVPVSSIITAVATVFTQGVTSPTDIANINSGINGAFNGFAWNDPPPSDPDATAVPPHAYLVYQVFDENMVYRYGGYHRVDESANMVWGNYTLPAITVDMPGFVYIYVFDSEQSTDWVYFDNLKYSHNHSKVVAGADYYPFGLAMESREIKTEPYRFGYQGQFSEKDLTTGWNEFELRMYDARFGKWLSTDPYGQFASPYTGMANAPNMGMDADGGLTTLPGVTVTAMSYGKMFGGMDGVFSIVKMFNDDCPPVCTGKKGLYVGPKEYDGSQQNVPRQVNAPRQPTVEDFLKAPNTSDLRNGTITQVNPTVLQRWGSSKSFVFSASYSIADGFWVVGATFTRAFTGEVYHLDGRPTVGWDKANALGETVATLMPFAPKGASQGHHIIPRQLFKELELGKYGFKLDHIKNLMELPTPFHGNHPAYTAFVKNEILKLEKITLEGLIDIQSKMTKQINRIHSSKLYERLNHYYKDLGF